MTDFTTVGSDPSIVELYEFEDDTGATRTYAFVLCFLSDQVFIVDTDSMSVLTVRETGSGPHAITFDHKRELAYIANFRESTISVLHTESPFDHLRDAEGRIVRLGTRRLPEGHN